MAKYIQMAACQRYHVIDVEHGEFVKTICGRDANIRYSKIEDNVGDALVCKQCLSVLSNTTSHRQG